MKTPTLTDAQLSDLKILTEQPQSTYGMKGAVFQDLKGLIDLGLANTQYPITPHGYLQALLTSKGKKLKKELGL